MENPLNVDNASNNGNRGNLLVCHDFQFLPSLCLLFHHRPHHLFITLLCNIIAKDLQLSQQVLRHS